ncbi:hypothetical protein [Campylobacter sp. RM12651]|uniref:hypothetical protein n=1 Tax=Campylobacter sp. RM12651 TaxID=1660079 RepID=UPI001EFB0DC8|nr:hypothetical protein [Campylobacter sp. RM12651]ULO04559.1 hypothetical protein AVBRAN_a0077 [Campylobacter sp. RM12651]
MQVNIKDIHNVEVFVSEICDYLKTGNHNLPIFAPKEDIYKISENSQGGLELINLCIKNYDLINSISGFETNSVEFDLFSYKYDDFISAFSKYSYFNELYKAIKLDAYNDKKDLIRIDIAIQSDTFRLLRLKSLA